MSWMSGRYRNVIQVVVGLLLVGQLAVASAITGPPASQPHAPLSIAVIGDQNTAGLNNRVVWPTLMAERTGWPVSNYALPEAGFAADGTGAQSFSYQVDRAQAGHPQMILLVAGTADASVQEIEAVRVGAVDSINKVIRGGERAAVVGPIWYETPVPDSVWRVNDAVQKVAETAGVPYFNAVDPPLLTRDLMQSDLGGPSDKGQSVIADKIAAWLRTQVVR
jgi:lysophospholipase L1-like esterase